MKTIFTFFALLTFGTGWTQPIFKANSELLSIVEQASLSKTLSKFSIIRFNTVALREAIRQQKSVSISLKISIDNVQYDLQLIENEIRSPNFKKVLIEEGKRKEQEIGECHTYKGTIGGDNKLKVRLYISDELFIGHIITPSGSLHFEPIQRYLPSANSNDTRTLVVKGEDFKNNFEEVCHPISLVQPKSKPNDGGRISASSGVPTSCRILELAAVGDDEWFNKYNVQSWAMIESIVNQVEDLYETSFNMHITIPYIEMHTGGDPYSAQGDPEAGDAALAELRDVWNSPYYTNYVSRDLVHMFTGRNFTSGVRQLRGIHYTGVVCNSPQYSYGLSIDGPYVISNTTSHEIGHGFNALHPDQTGDPEQSQCGTANASVMCSGDKRVPPYFSAQQLGRVNTHIQNNEACLLDFQGFAINGPDAFCNTASYSTNGIRYYYNRTWTSSPNITLAVDPNYQYGITVTATSTANGSGWVEATFNPGCPVTVRKNVNVNCGGRIASLNSDVEHADNISLYPNPTNGRFTIGLHAVDQPSELTITNMSGVSIYTWNLKDRANQSKFEIDLGRKAVGTYLIRVTTPNRSYMKKVIIGE